VNVNEPAKLNKLPVKQVSEFDLMQMASNLTD